MDLLSLPDNVFLKLLNELSNIHSQTLTNLAMTCWGMRRATIGAWKQLSVNVRALVSLSTQQQWGHVKAAILRDFLCSLGEGTRVCLSADWGRRNEEVPCHLSSCLGAMYALHTRPLDSVKTLSLEELHMDGFLPDLLPAMFPKLQELDVNSCQVGSRACSTQCPQLRSLCIYDTNLQPSQLLHLTGLQQLAMVDCAACSGVLQECLPALARNLTSLKVWAQQQVAAPAQQAISLCTRLQQLECVPVDTECLGCWAQALPGLSSLYISSTRVGDSELEQLVQLRHLTGLTVLGFSLSVDQSSSATAWKQVCVNEDLMNVLSLLFLPLYHLQKPLDSVEYVGLGGVRYHLPTVEELGSMQLDTVQQAVQSACRRATGGPAGLLATGSISANVSPESIADERVQAIIQGLQGFIDHRGSFLYGTWTAELVTGLAVPMGCSQWTQLSLHWVDLSAMGLNAIVRHMPRLEWLLLHSYSGLDAVTLAAFLIAADRSRREQPQPVLLDVDIKDASPEQWYREGRSKCIDTLCGFGARWVKLA